jgi:hypothetical protein
MPKGQAFALGSSAPWQQRRGARPAPQGGPGEAAGGASAAGGARDDRSLLARPEQGARKQAPAVQDGGMSFCISQFGFYSLGLQQITSNHALT